MELESGKGLTGGERGAREQGKADRAQLVAGRWRPSWFPGPKIGTAGHPPFESAA